jgi:transcription elongation factor GreA
MTKIPMTSTGVDQLREELKHLKMVRRPRVIAAIAEARGHGDLKENAEYHAAKEEQGFIEGRIRDIEHKLSHVQVIDITSMLNVGKVVFSATVTLLNVDTDQRMVYQIVGEEEADLKSGKISVTSPIARAVIGKHKGDIVEVTAPGGLVSYEIEEVIY